MACASRMPEVQAQDIHIPVPSNPPDKQLLIPYFSTGKWGYCDTLGNVIAPPIFDSVGFYHVDQASGTALAVYKKRGRLGMVSSQQNVVIPAEYDEINTKSLAGFVLVRKKKKLGIYNILGALIVPPEYDSLVTYFNQFGILAKKGKKMGAFSIDGATIIPFEYDHIEPYITYDNSPPIVFAYKNQSCFQITKDGKRTEVSKASPQILLEEVLPERKKTANNTPVTPDATMLQLVEKYDLDSISKDDTFWPYYITRKNNQFGAISRINQTVAFEPQYDSIKAVLQCGLAPICPIFKTGVLFHVRKDNRAGIVGDANQIILPIQYDDVKFMYDGIKFYENGLAGIIHFHSDYPIIYPKYESINLAATFVVQRGQYFNVYRVKTKNKWVFIGENGVEYFSF